MKKNLMLDCIALLVRALSFALQLLPYAISIRLGGFVAGVAYLLLPKRRSIVYVNLKKAFTGEKSQKEIRCLVKKIFIHFGYNFVDLLILPKMAKHSYESYVELVGKYNVDQAYQKGKGVIFLPVHQGSWEMSSIVGSSLGYPYNVVTNPQAKASKLDDLLNEYRKSAGANIIQPGIGGRDIIRKFKDNEIVAMMADQGGRDGMLVDFFGKPASMSIGAIKLALKYDVPIILAKMIRQRNGKHKLEAISYDLVRTDDVKKDIQTNLNSIFKEVEGWVKEAPEQYLWFYKVWKRSNKKSCVILDDGRTGHLRQSEAVARSLKGLLKNRNDHLLVDAIKIKFKNVLLKKLLNVYGVILKARLISAKIEHLRFFISKESYESLTKVSSEYVISTGVANTVINYVLAKDIGAENVSVLNAGVLGDSYFSRVIIMEHDKHKYKKIPKNVFTLKIALNLINQKYLERNSFKLLERFSHLKSNLKAKVGVLLGGDAKGFLSDESQVKIILHQLKEVANELNLNILLTTSRRTPPEVDAVVKRELKKYDRCPLLIVANDSNTPEAVGGILGLSDVVLVSSESVSMVSEAVSSKKPTVVFDLNEKSAAIQKHRNFINSLHEDNHLIYTTAKGLGHTIYNIFKNKFYIRGLDTNKDLDKALVDIL